MLVLARVPASTFFTMMAAYRLYLPSALGSADQAGHGEAGAAAMPGDDDWFVAPPLDAVADGFGATYSVEHKADGSVEVSHSGNVYIVDSTGQLIVEWPFGVGPATMANDISILLRSAP